MSNEEIRKMIGHRIQLQRKLRSLTQAEFAEKMGVRRAYISNIEQGQKGISFKKLFEICRLFNITITDLFPAAKTDVTEEREEIVSDITEMIMTLDTDHMKIVRTMIYGITNNSCKE